MKKRPFRYFLYRSLWSALDVIFPPVCSGCNQQGSRWCDSCQSKVNTLIDKSCCDVCGLPQPDARTCNDCLTDAPRFRQLRAWAAFDYPIRNALHKLKYRKDMSIGDALAAHMLTWVESLPWEYDMLIPIPLGKQRMKERGYNQVGMIAKPLAMALNVHYAPHGLVRKKETRTQVGLTKQQRKENIHQAFSAWQGVAEKSIVLFDDVATTGATLSSAADALLRAGAKNVYALTVARALPHHGLQHA